MKTLKKTLCLVLAMVMVFGLCAVSASAKLDYSDNDDITYAEAVDVLSGIGILKGDTRGFRPTDGITRAEAAKIIAYIMIGNATQADALKASTEPFTDVPVTHWAAGYVAYCASREIIGGMGDGTYHPNDPVTGLAFAKMLLRALGYGTQGEYVGGDWSVKTASDAIRYGVFDGNLAGASEKAATREECALYAFNVVAKKRSNNPDQWGLKKVTYSQLAGDYVANGAFSNISSAGTSVDSNKQVTFADDFKLRSRDAEADDFWRDTGHVWFIDEGKREAITAEYGGDANLKAVFTTAVTGADIYSYLGADGKKTTGTNKTTLQVNINGAESGNGYDADVSQSDILTTDTTGKAIQLQNFAKANSEVLNGTGNGVRTYLYAKYSYNDTTKEATLHVKVVIIDTYLAKVDTVKAAKGNKDAETAVDLLSIDTTNGANPLTGNVDTFATEEFAEGDYVLVSYSCKDNTPTSKYTIREMSAATVIEGPITRYNNNRDTITMVAGGTTYGVAKDASSDSPNIYSARNTTDVNAKTTVDGEDHILYLDSYGYIIGVGNVKAARNYVYLAQVGVKINTSATLSDREVLMGHVYYADGTNEILPIDRTTTNYKKVSTEPAPWDNWFAEGVNSKFDFDALKANGASDSDLADENKTQNLPGLYEIAMKNGKAILRRADVEFATGRNYPWNDGTGVGVTKSVYPITDPNNSITYRQNGKTVYFYVSGEYYDATEGESTLKVVPYIGVTNIPVAKASDHKADAYEGFVESQAAGKAVYALLVDDKTGSGDGDDVYFFLGTKFGQNTTYYRDGNTIEYYVYDKEGKAQTLTYDYGTNAKAKAAIEAAEESSFYKVNKSNNQLVAQGGYTDVGIDCKKIDKITYVNLATAKFDNPDDGTVRGTDEFTLRLTQDGGEAEYAINDPKAIVDLRGEYDTVTNSKALAALLTELGNETTPEYVNIAFAFGDDGSKTVTAIFLLANVGTAPTVTVPNPQTP